MSDDILFILKTQENGLTDFSKYRSLFPVLNNKGVYLNHAAVGPLPTPGVQAVNDHLKKRNSGIPDFFDDEFEILNQTKQRIAELINVSDPEQVTFTQNTTDALNTIANGIDWKKGDQILLHPLEFPSNVYPWMNQRSQGAEIVWLPENGGRVFPEDVEAALTPMTKVLSISGVQYHNGFRADLEQIGKLCRENGTYFIVDAIQALGALHFDAELCQADAVCAGGHKWLMAPQGIGFLWMRKSFMDQLQISSKGWLSVEDPWDMHNYDQPPAPGAQRFSGGNISIPGVRGLNESLKLFLDAGTKAIEQKIIRHTKHLINSIREDGRLIPNTFDDQKNLSGISSFKIPDRYKHTNLAERLAESGLYVSIRNDSLRLSPHLYNNEDDLNKACAILFTELTSIDKSA